MKTQIPSQQERTEMEQVLQSGLFDKAPRLGKFFRYICERYFEGQADQIKEYSIALEALGRGSDFDPKKDSIVRVEAHRLRKRLEDFYNGPGADHEIRILIPNGQYRPQFLSKEVPQEPIAAIPAHSSQIASQNPAQTPPESAQPGTAVPETEKVMAAERGRPRWPFYVLLLLVVCAAGAWFWYAKSHRKIAAAPIAEDTVATAPVAPTSGAELRILAGYRGPVYMDRQGHAWQPDEYFKGGAAKQVSGERFVDGEPDLRLLKYYRAGTFSYDIPLSAGTYELHLYFVETEYGRGNAQGGGEGARTFNVDVNGEPRLRHFDPLAEAGEPNRLDERVFKDIVPSKDGQLHLKFAAEGNAAILSALEVLPSAPGRIHPVRIVTQTNPVTDSDGRLWAADEYFSGGLGVMRVNVLLNPKERAIYQGERYGNFTYRIPLAPGKYRLTLHFAEQWFGTHFSNMAPLDSRSFDVSANGVPLLRNFNIGREAGGANRSLEKTFENIQPSSQGVLLLAFVPVTNYAEVNAIEVVETQ